MWKYIYIKHATWLNMKRRSSTKKKSTKRLIKNNTHYLRNRNTNSNIVTTAETTPTETHFIFLKKKIIKSTLLIPHLLDHGNVMNVTENWYQPKSTFSVKSICRTLKHNSVFCKSRWVRSLRLNETNTGVLDWRSFLHFLINFCMPPAVFFLFFISSYSVTDWMTSAHLTTGSQNTTCGSVIYYS